VFVFCDFCGSPMARWGYRAGDRDWQACERCHQAIEAGDREALLERVRRKPVPRTVSDRHAERFQLAAERQHEEFWTARRGRPEPL
jgi:hypothetical protein